MPMVKAEKRYSQWKHLYHVGHEFPISYNHVDVVSTTIN
jgi:hypothetical protein